MINKFKDFLKNKFKRKNSNDLSDQVDEGSESENEITDIDSPVSDHTGNYQYKRNNEDVEKIVNPGIKEKIFQRLSSLREKLKNINFSRPKSNNTSLKITKEKKSNKNPLISPNVGQAIEKFLGRSSRESVHQFFLASLIFTVTYTLAKISALSLKGGPILTNARKIDLSISLDKDFNPNTLAQVKAINPFRSNTGLGTKKKIADTKCEKAQQSSSLPIKLVNAVVLQDSVKSLASVQVRGDRILQEVREGEQISNMAKVFKISRLELLIKNLENGTCESITSEKLNERTRSPISVMSPAQSRNFIMSKKLPGIENIGNKFSISKKLLDERMKDIGAILTQTRAIKIQNSDGSISFKLTEMDPEGLFPYLGLQDQDIITSINGKPIYDMNEVMSLFSRIKNLESLSLGIRREGSESMQEYSIKK